MCESTVTFVTAFIDLDQRDVFFDNNPHRLKTVEARIEYFKKLAKTGLPIALFVCPNYKDIAQSLIEEFRNIKLIDIIDLKNTWTYNAMCHSSQNLPLQRNIKKDTFEFMVLMNAKTEFTNYVTYVNPFNTTHFAWIDFSICHILKYTEATLKYLTDYACNSLPKTLLVIPGCWTKQSSDRNFVDRIIWRFCGGLYLGDIESVRDFHLRTLIELPKFIDKHEKVTWETNFWTWLESTTDWSPQWFYAGHDDSMIYLPILH